MRAVLVTGSTTPIGAALIRSLLEAPEVERVLAVGIELDPGTDLPLGNAGLTYHRVDLTRERHVRRLIFGPVREAGVDAVVHTALHRSAHDQGKAVHRLNVEATRSLLHLCERHPTVRRFIYRSFAEVYRHDHEHPSLIGEGEPLELRPDVPQRVRDRVEADLTVCTRMGMSPLQICVLRVAEILAPQSGSQLWDWLASPVCLRPLGFDPMVNLISADDAARAVVLALRTDAQGVFNVPGRDTLPLSKVVELWHRLDVPAPGPLLRPLYWIRRLAIGTDFRYRLNEGRLHTSDLLDGARAREVLGYEPLRSIDWPSNGTGGS